MITGKDLIALGLKPNKTFSSIISHANAHGLSGEALRLYAHGLQPKHLLPHEHPVPFSMNIRAESDVERQNVEAVIRDMSSLMVTPTMRAGAVMPDACPTGAGQIPVGGVAVAHGAIHPSMHSADICCSVMMTAFGSADPKTVLDAAHSITHFGGGGRREYSNLPADLEEAIAGNKYLRGERSLFLAKAHLGTQGDGNHFLYVGRSSGTGETVMVTHHGSRGFGANLYKIGMAVAEAFRKDISPVTAHKNAWIPFDTEEGQAYWDALQIVRRWTKLNHETIHGETERIVGFGTDRFWNEHNFVFKDGDLFYHAKGATPLDPKFVPDGHPEGLRLVPLNMSQPILVVRGGTTDTNLGFAPHGAGRNVSRSEHKRTKAHKTVRQVFSEETAGLDVRFFSGKIDVSELPSAYKDAAAVRAQMSEFGLGEVVDEIIPYGCVMAGDWQDPRKTKHDRR